MVADDAYAEGGPGLHVVCVDPDVDPRQLTRDGLFLDQQTIDGHYEERSNLIGAIDPRWGSRFSRGVALQIAKKCGARLAEAKGIDGDTAARAWFFAIWTEVCTLVPARHLARRLAAHAKGELIVIPMASLTVHYLAFWEKNELEPLYLAAELRRAGANVVILLTGVEDVRQCWTGAELELRAVPHRSCCPCTTAAEPRHANGPTSLLVTAALRGLTRVRAHCPEALMVESIFSATQGPFDFGLLPPGTARPQAWTRRFARRSPIGDGSVQVFRAEALPDDLLTELVRAVRDVTETAFRRASDIVERCDVQNLHICDHTFFETAILAEATRRHGGCVFVWPHSTNAVHVETRWAEQIARVTCITRSGAETWRRRRPDLDCIIDSAFMLRQAVGARRFEPDSKLTIVVIAGAHNLRRMPLMDHIGHRSTYRSLFAALATLVPKVDIVFRSKGVWETDAWLREVVGDVSSVTFTDRPPTEIEMPNMIFLTVSHASSALLEGLSRGIPGMVAREISVEDYMNVDPSAVLTSDVSTIVAKIAACTNPTVFNAFVERQLSWYVTETHFPQQYQLG